MLVARALSALFGAAFLAGLTFFPLSAGAQESGDALRDWPSNQPIPQVSPYDTDIRVLNGTPTALRRIVGFTFMNDQNQPKVCSGLYIDAFHVLTAKHCTCHGNEYHVTNDPDMLRGTREFTRAIIEPGFQGGAPCRKMTDFNPREGNDIAILKLDHPLLAVPPVRTCRGYSIVRDIELLDIWSAGGVPGAIVSGYGQDPADAGTDHSQEAQRSGALTVNSLDCASPAARSRGCVAYREMILGMAPKGGVEVDSCPGDSGASAYINRGGTIVPIGIVSRAVSGAPTSKLCGQGGVYTMLGRADIIAWLQKKLPKPDATACGLDE
ncbi:trypsin [Rhizobium sp. PP-F2F-G38]|nr:trypsin [Rhizobium sp. PP-F2F-G38]